MEEVRAYRCRRCAELFNDDRWKNECKAPISIKGANPRRATVQRLFELASVDRTATVAEQAEALDWLTRVRLEQAKDNKQKP